MVHEKENYIVQYLLWEGWFKIQCLKNPGKNVFREKGCFFGTG